MQRTIKPISSEVCEEWVIKKHYAHRKPRIQFAFGVFVDGLLEGVVSYGYPATPFIARGICGLEYEKNVLELNRLVVNSGVPRNTTSYLVSHSIRMLPKDVKIVISYADDSIGHIGYIYQATNFIYTGKTIDMKEWKLKGENLHSQNVCKKIELEKRQKDSRFEQTYRPKKHRYIFFRGNTKEKEKMMSKLKYDKQPYPKELGRKYQTTDITKKQSLLGNFLENGCCNGKVG
jgi:hypothetical protein